MLILADYLLLAFEDRLGKPYDAVSAERVGAGALLVDLAIRGRIDVVGRVIAGQPPGRAGEPPGRAGEPPGRAGEPGRAAGATSAPGARAPGARAPEVVVVDASPTGDALLDEAMAGLRAADGLDAVELTHRLAAASPAARTLDTLVEQGLIARRDSRVLGVFPTTRWLAAGTEREAALRRLLRRVLVDRERPDLRTAALVTIIAATGAPWRVLAPGDVATVDARRDVERAAALVVERAWGDDAGPGFAAAAAGPGFAAADAGPAAAAAGALMRSVLIPGLGHAARPFLR